MDMPREERGLMNWLLEEDRAMIRAAAEEGSTRPRPRPRPRNRPTGDEQQDRRTGWVFWGFFFLFLGDAGKLIYLEKNQTNPSTNNRLVFFYRRKLPESKLSSRLELGRLAYASARLNSRATLCSRKLIFEL
jgi:hypothetical protein